MDQFKDLLARFSLRQKFTILLTAAAVVAGLAGLVHWNRERDFRPLYLGLAPEDGGAVLAQLRESGVEYRVDDSGGAVLVPAARVAELRLQLAAAGLPRSGRIGFELFDRGNFGATEFAEQVNYHRALEGELERTVAALAEVEQARVHLTLAKDSVFAESRQQAKASVLLRLRPGARLAPQNVLAIAHLMASAVPGLAPEAVSILDVRGNLLSRPRPAGGGEGAEGSDTQLEYRQRMERDLLQKVSATIEPLVGAGKFRAGVSIDCDFTSGEQSEENFDPARSVMSSSQRTEDMSGAAVAGGVPGTASNLPRPLSRPGSSPGGVTRRTENVAYQTSRTVRRMRLPMGAVKRISLAVLVDQDVRWEGTGATARRVLVAPQPDTLKRIRDLVVGVAGLVTERGDQLILESLPFESTLHAEPPGLPGPANPQPGGALPPWLAALLADPKTLRLVAGGAVLVVVVASIGLFLFLRGRKKRSARTAVAETALNGPEGGAARTLPASAETGQSLEERITERAALKGRLELEALAALKPVTTKKGEVLAKHISKEVKKDPIGIAQIVRSWLEGTDK